MFTYFTDPTSQPGQLDSKRGLPVSSALPLLPAVSLPRAVSVSQLLVAVGAPPVASFPAAPFPPSPSSACTGVTSIILLYAPSYLKVYNHKRP